MSNQLVTDELWELVEPLIPSKRRSKKGGRPRADDRAALEGILYVLMTGCQWRLIPKSVGCSVMTCWRRLSYWQLKGVWDKLQQKILGYLRKEGQLELARGLIDSASVRAVFGGTTRGQTPRIAGKMARNTRSSPTQTVYRSRQKSLPQTETTYRR